MNRIRMGIQSGTSDLKFTNGLHRCPRIEQAAAVTAEFAGYQIQSVLPTFIGRQPFETRQDVIGHLELI